MQLLLIAAMSPGIETAGFRDMQNCSFIKLTFLML